MMMMMMEEKKIVSAAHAAQEYGRKYVGFGPKFKAIIFF